MSPLRSHKRRAVPFWLCAVAVPFAAYAETDACTLLTSAQVSTVVGVAVGGGTHVTPTFLKTCTWTPTVASDVTAVTVNLQTVAFYDGAKRMAIGTKTAVAGASVKPAPVGDDGYYDVAGDLVTLLFKKGETAVKVAVYAKLGVDSKEAMELALGKQVAAKL